MSDETKALVPVDERHVDFYGDEVITVLLEEGGARTVYVPIRPISTYMGLSWPAQLRRIRRTEVLNEVSRPVAMTATGGGERTMICLPLDYLAGWLFGVDPERVKPELKAKVLRYQRECYRVLAQAFAGEAITVAQQAGLAVSADPRIVEIAEQIEILSAQITFLREHMAAILAAGQQIEQLSAQLDQATGLLQTLIGRQATTEQRVDKIDARTQQLSPASQRQVQAFIGHMVEKTKKRARPLEWHEIYGAIKRRFNVGSYSQIPDDLKDELMHFLREMLDAATNGELPQQGQLFG